VIADTGGFPAPSRGGFRRGISARGELSGGTPIDAGRHGRRTGEVRGWYRRWVNGRRFRLVTPLVGLLGCRPAAQPRASPPTPEQSEPPAETSEAPRRRAASDAAGFRTRVVLLVGRRARRESSENWKLLADPVAVSAQHRRMACRRGVHRAARSGVCSFQDRVESADQAPMPSHGRRVHALRERSIAGAAAPGWSRQPGDLRLRQATEHDHRDGLRLR